MLFNRWVFIARLQRIHQEEAEQRNHLIEKTKEFLNKKQSEKISSLMDTIN